MNATEDRRTWGQHEQLLAAVAEAMMDALLRSSPAHRAAYMDTGDVPAAVAASLVKILPSYGLVLTRDDGSPL